MPVIVTSISAPVALSIAMALLMYLNQERWEKREELRVASDRNMQEGARGGASRHTNQHARSGMDVHEQSKWKEAKGLELQVLETRMTVLGAEHPDTVQSMHNLLSTYEGGKRSGL